MTRILSMIITAAMIVPSLIPQLTDVTLPSGIEEEEIDEEVGDFTDGHDDISAGLMFSIFTPNEVLHETYRGQQDIDEDIDVSEESVFKWGSITKLLTWVSVMQLVEADRIDLNEDVDVYLPDDFLEDFEYDDPVTMLDLMNHQGGFQDEIPDLFVTELPDDYSLEEELQDNQPEQLYEPGEVTAYSNWGAALAGYIVEEVSGQPFYEYVHENILDPLDMNDTALAPDLRDDTEIRKAGEEAVGHLPSIASSEDEQRYMPLYPAGSAVGTMPDLVTFAQSLFPSNTDTLLFNDDAALESMFDATETYGDTEAPRNAHGFRVRLFDNAVYGHSGNTNSFTANLLLDIEEEIGYVMMANEAQEVTYNFLFPQDIFGDRTMPGDYDD